MSGDGQTAGRGGTIAGAASAYASAAFLGLGAASTVLYAAHLSPLLSTLAFLLVGAGAGLAIAVGRRLHRPAPSRPWTLMLAACLLFLAGALLRPWATAQTGAALGLADAFTIPGYVLLLCGFWQMLRARGNLERDAVLDGLSACVGAGLLSLVLFALPAGTIEGRPRWLSLVAALYPVLDAALVLVLVNLVLTSAVRLHSQRLLLLGMISMLAGDIGYAVIGARGELRGPAGMDLPYLLAYTCLGAAALHPSMVEVCRTMPRLVHAWSWPRLLLLVPSLLTPSVLLLATDRSAPGTAMALAGVLLTSLLVLRAVTAVSRSARAEEVFRRQATHDALTNLPNRLAVTADLATLLRVRRADQQPLWLCFLDLDGFKLVNDSRGHEAGDLLIVEVARRIGEVVPAQAQVARIGGDEFVISLRGDEGHAAALADGVLTALARPFLIRGGEVVVSASIGMARASATSTPESLMRDADTAMYRAKADGRNRCVVFDGSMREQVRRRVEIELALRHALASRQLRVAYQPVMDLTTGDLAGVEALLRWDHPVTGPISPEQFIPVAEESGLIDEIGLWVLDESLAQVASWRASGVVGEDFWVSVNVSPRQLRDRPLEEAVRADLARHGLDARVLVLEITESVMLDETDRTERTLRALAGMGVRIAVDDFGTGYSALGYLRRHPLTSVKIDRSFVSGLGSVGGEAEIVRAVVAMASALGLAVVAEGVETEGQRRALDALGVVLAQGWLWAPAMDPAAFCAWLGGAQTPRDRAPMADEALQVAQAVGNS